MKRRLVNIVSLCLIFCLSGCGMADSFSMDEIENTLAESNVNDDKDNEANKTEDGHSDGMEVNLNSEDRSRAQEALPNDENKAVTEEATQNNIENQEEEKMLKIEVNGHILYAKFENNSSADALKEKLEEGAITLDMHDYGSFEKVCSLPWNLPRNDTQITTEAGDVILYQGNQITIYYDENSWNFTRMAKIQDISQDELKEVLGEGNVAVVLSVE